MANRREGNVVKIEPLAAVSRDNLTQRVYAQLRTALMEGQFKPGHRFKIRDLAESMGVSETPIREALMQLVCERGLDMQASRSITVATLTYRQYVELREIRMQLEGLAAERAVANITEDDIAELEAAHKRLVAAEASGEWREAVRANWHFHFMLFRKAEMPELLAILEGIWLRNGPLMNFLYPHAKPTYAKRHQHLNVIDGLRKRSAARVRAAIQADLDEGGKSLMLYLQRLEEEQLAAAQA
ncbi:DNA-binding GntR family transcriptional regulator [Rhodoligotrophos appendicifer]|uniref:GntR family transcriptional regulator n=1 Tax=Rhodoligotrophos appendicifer TaxID=987056 RepID=UPI00118527AE|nr:GntR family transcriptional regulator [Rhodoligotrophos appendicifer]